MNRYTTTMTISTYRITNKYNVPCEWVAVCGTNWLTPKMRDEQRHDIKQWCHQTFGYENWYDECTAMPPRWKEQDAHNYSIIFRDKKDLDWFLLKWA